MRKVRTSLRAACAAWLPAFPPGERATRWPTTLSPLPGRRSAVATTSIWTLPTAMTPAGASAPIPAKGGLIQQRLHSEGVVACLQLGQSPQIESVQDRLQRSHPSDVGGALGGRVFAHWERVEVDGAAIVVPAQHCQQLQRLPGVDAAHQQAVVGLAVAVVEVDAEEAAFS